MITGGILLIVVLVGMVLAFVILATVIMKAIQSSVRQATHQIAGKVIDKALDVGSKELVKGAYTVGKMVQEEMVKSDPQKMGTEVTKLAKRNKGELTLSVVMSELNVSRELAEQTLEMLLRQKVCIKGEQEESYIFPGFKDKKKFKVCEYCDAEFDLGAVGDACPSCGAKLKTSSKWI